MPLQRHTEPMGYNCESVKLFVLTSPDMHRTSEQTYISF